MIDVSDPQSPELVGSIPIQSVYSETVGVAIADRHAFVLERYAWFTFNCIALHVIDVSTPSLPVEVGYLDFGIGDSYGLAVANTHVYIPDSNAGLRVIDVSDPHNPMEVGLCEFMTGGGVAVSGTYAYVASQGSQSDNIVRVIDVSNPTLPTEVGHINFSGLGYGVDLTGIAASGRYAYVPLTYYDIGSGDNLASLRVIDFSTPSAPVDLGYYERYGGWPTSAGVTIFGDFIYWAAWDMGMEIYDVSACEGNIFIDGFESSDTSAWSVVVP